MSANASSLSDGEAGELALHRFLHRLIGDLEQARDVDRLLSFSLRSAQAFLGAPHVCLAAAAPGESQVHLRWSAPREAEWDAALLTEFLLGRNPSTPRDTIMAPLRRRHRNWGILALRRPDDRFSRSESRALSRIAEVLSHRVHFADRERILDVRTRIDRKIMQQLDPKDLVYHLLDGLRSLTQYDHSSAVLMGDDDGRSLVLTAEQIAVVKLKSRRIGLTLPLDDELRRLLTAGVVYGFDRHGDEWRVWHGEEAAPLARLLDYRRNSTDADDAPREAALLLAPLAVRGRVLGVLKVAGRHAGTFGPYEAELLQRFMPDASVAIQNAQSMQALRSRILDAERKHVLADLARGVSHDLNNALGSMLPLVQQMREDVAADRIDARAFAADLAQIEESLQVCRRIFGGLVSVARGAARPGGEGNVRLAILGALSILEDGMKRRGVRVELDVAERLPPVRGGQGDLEQLVLNLASNARDAMPDGGVFSVRAWPQGRGVAVCVADTGCGIPPELLSRVQEPFITTKQEGSGLGLAICRSIVWEMRGRMEIQSKPGNGTKVMLHLPAAE